MQHGFDMSIPNPHFVDSAEQAHRWMMHLLETFRPSGGLGLDSETTGIHKTRDVIIYWSLSDDQNRLALPAQYIPMFKEAILENNEIDFDMTRAKFDAHQFANMGVDLTKARSLRDTTVMSWLLNENNQGRHGLKETVADHLGRVTPTFEQTFGKIPPKKIDKITGKNVNPTMSEIITKALADPTSDQFFAAVDYASLDAYNSHYIRKHFDNLLAQVPIGWGSLYDYFYRVSVPYTKLLFKLERRGFPIDVGFLRDLKGPMEDDMLLIEQEFGREAGRLLNLNSPIDVPWFFFEHLKKAPTKYTKGGASGNKKPSTDAEVLEDWAGEGDVWAQKLMRYRSISKIYGTYVTGLMNHVDWPQDYRIRTSLNQSGTVTGRLSSSEPNLQNIPRPGEDKFKIREAFIPDSGKALVVADYAQLEMRLMAHFSGDDKMINAILNNIDLHCFTVSEMEGIPYDEIIAAVKADKKHKKGELGRELTERELELLLKRQNAKATGFGIIYGIGGPRLAAQLTRETGKYYDEEEGWRLIKKWLAVFPGVDRYIEATKADVMRTGRVQTLLGRFRRFGDLRGMNRRDAAQAERQAVNSIIQGTAADIVTMAMLACDADPELSDLGAEMLLQIHDELIFMVPDVPETIMKAKKRVQFLMENPFDQPLRVPLPVEAGHGYSWASAK
jgi:DNA polymerase-1